MDNQRIYQTDEFLKIDDEVKIIKNMNPSFTPVQRMLKWYESKGAVVFIDFKVNNFKIIYGMYQKVDELYRQYSLWKSKIENAEKRRLKDLDKMTENAVKSFE